MIRDNFIPDSQLSQSRWLIHNIMYHPEKKIIIFLTPKVANTSLKKSILEGCGFELNYDYPAGFVYINPQDAFLLRREDPEIYSVGFVREPISRLISGWKNKFKEGQETTFDEFIEYLKNTDNLYVDKHFRPQSYEMIFNGEILIDKYYKFEEFTKTEGWEELVSDLKRFNINMTPLDHLNKSEEKQYEITEEHKDFILKRYKGDYMIFNY